MKMLELLEQPITEGNFMLSKELTWFFSIFQKEFRQGKLIAFEMVMFLALAHFFGFYNPKQLADFLGIPHQQFYSSLKEWSLYYLKEMLLCFMVKKAAEELKPVLEKSNATKSRAGITISVDNCVIDRLGKLLRCVWSWYSGRFKKVVKGNDLLGITLTIGCMAIPLHLIFCSKQGRTNTDKPSLLISMLERLKGEFYKEGIDIIMFPITMDSWFVSNDLREKLYKLGFKKIIIAGKGNYIFKIKDKKQNAFIWKKEIVLTSGQWGIDVPSCRMAVSNPTFGNIILFFYEKSTTRNYYLIDFSQIALRGAEIWRIWKQHCLIECFWKILKSTFKIKSMQLQGNGLYTALFIKVLSYLLALRLKAYKSFSKLSVTQIMRKIMREEDLEALLIEHFH
jgi:hypothetical protein